MRDIVLEETFFHDFTTRAFATGIPTVLAGTPVLSVLEENNVTPITAGVSISVDRASVVGLNMATIVATAANGYESGKGYSIYISTGTVGGVSVVGEVVGQFTIEASAAAQDLANGTDGLGAIKGDTAAILLDTAEIGTAGAGLTNINLPNQTMNIVGNITGNLSGSVGSLTTNNDKTGYSISGTKTTLDTLNDVAATDIVSAGAITTLAGAIVNVDLVDTTTTNSDMRGTDSALLASSAPTNFSDLAITVTTGLMSVGTNNDKTGYSISGTITTLDGLNDFDPTADAVANVTIVATTTTNTDMRGTDSAATEAKQDIIDTNVDAIKVTTDKFTFTIANQVDSNIQFVNDQVISGDGGVGTEWQGA